MALISKHLLLATALCLGASRHSRAQARLTPADFVVAGIPDNYPYVDLESDMARIGQILGRPDTVRRYEFRPGDGDSTTIWAYSGLIVEFGSIARSGVTLTSPRVATRRGLRVGDAEQRLLALYGPPSRREDSEWIYEDPRESLHAMIVAVKEGRVVWIFVGTIWD